MNPSSVTQLVPTQRSGDRANLSDWRGLLGAIGIALLLTGCATSGSPKDPIEGFNRAMFAINFPNHARGTVAGQVSPS